MRRIAASTLVTAVLAAASPHAADPQLRYVANAGVMVTLDGLRILIDAPIRDGIPPYATSSPEERRKLEGATAPYDGVSAILVTHWHEDHFSPEAVAEHLRHNTKAILISSQEVVARVREVAADLGDARFAGRTPAQGAISTVPLGSLKVHVIRAKHNATRRWPEEHVAFLVEGSTTVLHTGDADLAPENFTALGALPRVDLAIVPFWHLLNDATRTRTIEGVIRPGRIVGMHLPPSDAATVQRRHDDKKLTATLLVTPATEVAPRR